MLENSEKIKIYILSFKPDLVADAISYLCKKDFEVLVFESAVKLVEAMKTIKPKCVMLSSDAIENLEEIPKKLALHFKVPVVGYVEQENMLSLMRLHKMQTEYKIRPPITGAASYRVIQKIIS